MYELAGTEGKREGMMSFFLLLERRGEATSRREVHDPYQEIPSFGLYRTVLIL